jgi:GDPmannose 4,6-dehydratase
MSRWRSNLENLSEHFAEINNPNGRIRLEYADLNDPNSLNKLVSDLKPNYVFHLGAHSYPLTSFHLANEVFNTNINGTENILAAIKRYSPHAIVHVCSSSEVFGRVPQNKVPISEDESFHPASPYAISKAATDLIGRFYAEAYGLNTQITRMFTHTGPRRGDVFAESSFAKQIALAEAKLIKPTIKVGNLNSLRTIADVRDAVDAYFKLVTINPVPGSYYNIGGAYTCKVEDILNKLLDLSSLTHFQIEVDEKRLRPIDADLQIPNTQKFANHTGWQPKIDFETTMLDLLNYWRNRVKKYGNFLVR